MSNRDRSNARGLGWHADVPGGPGYNVSSLNDQAAYGSSQRGFLRMTGAPEITVVRAVFLDTNAARKAGFLLSSSWVQHLCRQAQDLSICLYLPQLVLDEWLYDLCERGSTKLAKLLESRDQLNELVGHEIITVTGVDEATLLDELKKAQVNRILAAGFQVVPNATPDLASLIKKAVQKVPPFEAGDKGFRDAVIIETIATQVAAHHRENRVVVVSADSAFCKGISAVSGKGLRIETCDVESVNARIEGALEDAVQKTREHEAAIALAFLNANKDVIYEHVRHCHISEWSLKYGRDVLDPLHNATIKRVNAVTPKEITGVLAKFGFLDAKPGTTGIPILFSVTVDLNLTITQMNPARLFGGKSIPLNAPSDLPDESLGDPKLPFTVEADVTIEHSVSMRAIATRADDQEHPLKDLRIVEDFA